MSLGVGGEGGGLLVERDCLVAEVESKPPSGLARVRGKVDCFLEMNLGLVEFKNNGGFWGTNLSGVRLLADKAPLGAWLSSNIFFFFFFKESKCGSHLLSRNLFSHLETCNTIIPVN